MAPFEMLMLFALAILSRATPMLHPNSLPFPQYHFDLTPDTRPTANRYQCFSDGTKATAYPLSANWLSFDTIWKTNQPAILSRNGGDTYAEHYLREAIEQSSREHKLDPRLVLAAVLQVSGGKVTAPCLGPSRVKCDQTFDVKHPQASILRMVDEGLQIVAMADCWIAFADRFTSHAECADSKYLSDVANRLLGWDGRGRGSKDCQQSPG